MIRHIEGISADGLIMALIEDHKMERQRAGASLCVRYLDNGDLPPVEWRSE